jgi:hypothetical protein
MELFAAVFASWTAVLFGGKLLWRYARRWRQARRLEVARSLGEVRSAEYYARLSPDAFHDLVKKALETRRYLLLGNPWLGAARHQGYAWSRGVKMVLVDARQAPLTPRRLLLIAQRASRVKANRVLVFSPFDCAPKETPPRLEVLHGRRLCDWFSILELRPPNLFGRVKDICDCGALAEERVSRSGRAVMSCTRYPDCRVVREKLVPGIVPLEALQRAVRKTAARPKRATVSAA